MRKVSVTAGALALAMFLLPRTVWASPGASEPVVLAQSESRAVIIVSTNVDQPPKRVCVRFPEQTITGEEALRRAGSAVDATFYYGFGYGAAVCSLCGVGCPADDTCTKCGGEQFWKYWRAPAGSTTFKASNVGSSSTDVHDGDVEGWAWNNGKTAPAYASVDDVCGPPASSSGDGTSGTTPATRASGAIRHPDPTTAATARGAAPSTSTTAGSGSASTAPTVAEATTGSASSTTADDEVAANPRSASRRSALGRDSRGGGANVVGLAAFSVLLGGVLGWIWWVRRRRAAG